MTSKMKINASPRCVPDSVVLRNNKKRDFDPTKRKVWIYFFRIAVNRATTRTQEDQEEQEGEEEQTRRTTTTTTSSTSTHPPELQLSYQRTLSLNSQERQHDAVVTPRAPCRIFQVRASGPLPQSNVQSTDSNLDFPGHLGCTGAVSWQRLVPSWGVLGGKSQYELLIHCNDLKWGGLFGEWPGIKKKSAHRENILEMCVVKKKTKKGAENPWKSNCHFYFWLVSEFHHYF